jgi:hypothetical protein
MICYGISGVKVERERVNFEKLGEHWGRPKLINLLKDTYVSRRFRRDVILLKSRPSPRKQLTIRCGPPWAIKVRMRAPAAIYPAVTSRAAGGADTGRAGLCRVFA